MHHTRGSFNNDSTITKSKYIDKTSPKNELENPVPKLMSWYKQIISGQISDINLLDIQFFLDNSQHSKFNGQHINLLLLGISKLIKIKRSVLTIKTNTPFILGHDVSRILFEIVIHNAKKIILANEIIRMLKSLSSLGFKRNYFDKLNLTDDLLNAINNISQFTDYEIASLWKIFVSLNFRKIDIIPKKSCKNNLLKITACNLKMFSINNVSKTLKAFSKLGLRKYDLEKYKITNDFLDVFCKKSEQLTFNNVIIICKELSTMGFKKVDFDKNKELKECLFNVISHPVDVQKIIKKEKSISRIAWSLMNMGFKKFDFRNTEKWLLDSICMRQGRLGIAETNQALLSLAKMGFTINDLGDLPDQLHQHLESLIQGSNLNKINLTVQFTQICQTNLWFDLKVSKYLQQKINLHFKCHKKHTSISFLQIRVMNRIKIMFPNIAMKSEHDPLHIGPCDIFIYPNLMIEVDGGGHDDSNDLFKDALLSKSGYRVIRLKFPAWPCPSPTSEEIDDVLKEKLMPHFKKICTTRNILTLIDTTTPFHKIKPTQKTIDVLEEKSRKSTSMRTHASSIYRMSVTGSGNKRTVKNKLRF